MKVSRAFDASMSSSKDYPIAAATNIQEGQLVKLSGGLVVGAVVAETGAILGVAAESHTGTTDAFNARNNGTVIRIYDSPVTVMEGPAPRATATSGTTTTLVATGIATFADDDFNGGFMKLVSKAAASANTDSLGTIYPITDFTASSKTFTTTKTAGGAITAGDVFEIYPPNGFAKGNLDAGISKLVITATAALAIKSYGEDMDRGVTYHVAALHQNGNKQS
jgi:hypothetical protein